MIAIIDNYALKFWYVILFIDLLKKHETNILSVSIQDTHQYDLEDDPEDPLYQHDWVNHSKNFVDPTTKKHTNACEGHWGGLKKRIPAKNRNRYQLENFFMWHQWLDENWHRLWESFIEFLRVVRYDGNSQDQPVQTPYGQGNRQQYR